jgi:uncharacterized SAM-binding protein YcdF (DUF218 family)
MLVIHAWHMPRAAKEFEQAGFKVTSAATVFAPRYRTDAAGVYPTAGALQQSGLFMHEMIVMLWYRLLPAPDQT